MPARIAIENWNRQIWKVLRHPAVEFTLFVIVILTCVWIIADSEAFIRQTGLPIVGPR